MAIPVAIAALAKKLLLDKAFREIKKRTTHDEVVEVFEEVALRRVTQGIDSQPPLVFNGKKASTRGGIILSGVGLAAYALSMMGYISPEVAEFINTLISNPEVQSSVDCLADKSLCPPVAE